MSAEPASDRRPRKPISKRLRFEIYKRDAFTCVYCGRTPPATVLELDHIDPHAHGGSDDPTNLVTACTDCNAGKSDRPLGETIPRIGADKVAEMQERVEQMRAYREWRGLFDQELRAGLPDVWQAWIDAFGGSFDGKTYEARVDFPSEKALLEYMAELPMDQILEAVRIASWKYRKSDLARADVSRYFFGVLRSKSQEADEARRQISVTWDELVTQVPELEVVRDDVSTFSPLDPWNFCGERIWQGGWVVRFDDGTSHDVAAPVARVDGLVGRKSENARDPILGSQTARDLALRTIKAAVPACGQTCTCGRPKRPPREADYPRCPDCGQVTAPIDRRESCAEIPKFWEGREFAPVPFGREGSILQCAIAENWGRYRRLKEPKTFVPKERCPDCRTPIGGFHHDGCRFEACPICGDTATGCGSRGHRATVMAMSGKQAMARMRQMHLADREAAATDEVSRLD